MASERRVTSNCTDGERPKVVVIMGPAASGKSKLAIDLASHFPVEVINADSMQGYRGLDVLANKLPLSHQNATTVSSPHLIFLHRNHVLIIYDILARNRLPVVVGGTNYYIQALLSPFLLDDSAQDMDESCLGDPPGIESIEITIERVRII